MNDLISRQAAIDNLERYRELFSWDDGDRERAILSRVIKELQSMPSAEKKGRWLNATEPDENDNVRCECSECGHSDVHSKSVEVPFCWFCGARMEE